MSYLKVVRCENFLWKFRVLENSLSHCLWEHGFAIILKCYILHFKTQSFLSLPSWLKTEFLFVGFCLFVCLLLFGLVSFRWPQQKDFSSEHQPCISVEKTPSRAGQAIFVFLGVSITTWVGYSRDLKENINNGIKSQKPGRLPSAVTQQKPVTSLGPSSFPLANRVELDPL